MTKIIGNRSTYCNSPTIIRKGMALSLFWTCSIPFFSKNGYIFCLLMYSSTKCYSAFDKWPPKNSQIIQWKYFWNFLEWIVLPVKTVDSRSRHYFCIVLTQGVAFMYYYICRCTFTPNFVTTLKIAGPSGHNIHEEKLIFLHFTTINKTSIQLYTSSHSEDALHIPQKFYVLLGINAMAGGR